MFTFRRDARRGRLLIRSLEVEQNRRMELLSRRFVLMMQLCTVRALIAPVNFTAVYSACSGGRVNERHSLKINTDSAWKSTIFLKEKNFTHIRWKQIFVNNVSQSSILINIYH